MTTINSFRGDYGFLSNFALCTVPWQGITFSSTEAAYQASKTSDRTLFESFERIPPELAKSKGRGLTLRDGWEDRKVGIMTSLVHIKFTTDDNLRKRLLLTGERTLIEGNTWNDTFWGMCAGVGDNMLGRILMDERAQLS